MFIGADKKYFGLCGRITSALRNVYGKLDIRVLKRSKPATFPQRVLQRIAQTPRRLFTLQEASRVLQVEFVSGSEPGCCYINLAQRRGGEPKDAAYSKR